jgi:hypothetical protein
MKVKALKAVTLLLVYGLSCGCVTRRLWENAEYNEPSSTPNVQLYYSDAKHDVLVTYDELRPISDTINRRGYFLLENSHQSHRARKPVFVDVHQSNQLKKIPIVAKGMPHATNEVVGIVAEANARTFDVILNGQLTGPYDLPVYSSNARTAMQIALTPAAVVADTIIAGTVVGLIIWAAHGFDNIH